MKKPKPSNEVPKSYIIPKKIREKLEIRPYLLNIPLWDYCNAKAHVDAIPVHVLAEINVNHAYLEIVQTMYRMATLEDNDFQLTQAVKEHIRNAHSYCSTFGFKKKFIAYAAEQLRTNESYIRERKINAAKKRNTQEAELLAVDLIYRSLKQYRSSVLGDDITNISDIDVPDNVVNISDNVMNTSDINESANDVNESIILTKNDKNYTIKLPVSCLAMPHTPKSANC